MPSAAGRGIAYPHATSIEITELICVLGISKDGLNFNSPDGQLCHIILLTLSPKNDPCKHRKFITRFRTMLKNTPDIPTHLVINKKNLFTKTGSFLRKYSIDELPQLINIIKGDLVFIGPRPALYNQEDLIKLRTKKNIHQLAPGLTGWAQVNGRDELSIADKVKMDYFYLKNKSVSLDIKILFLTAKKVLKAEDVSF